MLVESIATRVAAQRISTLAGSIGCAATWLVMASAA
jgi:hypothetical protein